MSPSASLALALAPAALSALTLFVLLAVWVRVRALARPLAALEQRLQALDRQSAQRESESSAPSPSSVPRRPVPMHRVDPAESSAVAGPTLISVPSLATPPAAGPAAASAELARRFGAIWSLAESGTPTPAIARQTGQPIGQVELILGLKRRLAADSQPRGGRT